MTIDQILQLLEKILGIGGLIPEGWKSAIAGFVAAIIAFLVQLGIDLPDWVTGFEAALVGVIYILVGLVLKYTRAGRQRRLGLA